MRSESEHALDRAKGELGPTVARSKSHLPIPDQPAVFEPFVGESKDDGARQPAAKSAFDLPFEHLAFARFAFAE